MSRIPKWRVRVSPHMSYIETGANATAAKAKVWEDIKNGYTYGYNNWRDFNKKIKAIRIK